MVFQSWQQFGTPAFLRAYHSLPLLQADKPSAIARRLDVSERTVNDWISGRRCPPRAAVYALWLESMDGRAAMHRRAARGLCAALCMTVVADFLRVMTPSSIQRTRRCVRRVCCAKYYERQNELFKTHHIP